MKIIKRYVLKEHVGPFIFAATALTSIMLLQYIAKRFGDLVGKGLPWSWIGEFFVLSLPFTIAMTMPMAVLVAVLYAFSRMASENEITAMRAGGISTRRLLVPTLVAASVIALVMLAFNDQILPRANHRLSVLQMAIFQAKPTFVLRSQVINTVKEGQLYLRAEHLDEATSRMRGVVIYDLSDPGKRKTIYADSGMLAFAPNRRDLEMTLFHGSMLTVPTDHPGELTRIAYNTQRMRVPGVANGQFADPNADTASKGDREMTVCEMQAHYLQTAARLHRAQYELALAKWEAALVKGSDAPRPTPTPAPHAGGIGGAYCGLLHAIFPGSKPQTVAPAGKTTWTPPPVHKLPVASPAELHRTPRASTPSQQPGRGGRRLAPSKQPSPPPQAHLVVAGERTEPAPPQVHPLTHPQVHSQVHSQTHLQTHSHAAAVHPQKPKRPAGAAGDTLKAAARAKAIQEFMREARSPHGKLPAGGAGDTLSTAARAQAIQELMQEGQPQVHALPQAGHGSPSTSADSDINNPRIAQARLMVENAQDEQNRYSIEIQKKFSLAAACIVFVLVGVPLALRFPRGGVGLTIGASLLIFSFYYVCLIGGESLADRNLLTPFWAMWAANIIFGTGGLIGVARMGREPGTVRGGGMSDVVASARNRLARVFRRGPSEVF